MNLPGYADTVIERTIIDDVQVFWTEIEGPRVGALAFGVGRAHEAPARGGISHLVEHLALAPLRQQEYQHNATVEDVRTVFFAAGSDGQVAEFLEAVTKSLGALPLDRLGMERRILRQEGRDRRPGPNQTLAWYRFGAMGFGNSAMPEFGLGWLGHDVVAEWATSRFTAGNAALWLNGPPPDGLRLHLSAGQRASAPSLDPIPGLVFPTFAAVWNESVGLTWLAERTVASTVLLELAQRRARDVLRFDRGLVYDVQSSYEPLTDTVAHCVLATDCTAANQQVVMNHLLEVVERLANELPTREEIDQLVRSQVELGDSPQARFGLLSSAVANQLFGRPYTTPRELAMEYVDLEPGGVRDAMVHGMKSLLIAGSGTSPRSTLNVYPMTTNVQVQGQRYLPPGLGRPWQKRPELVVGDEGVKLVPIDGPPLGVRFDQVVVFQHYDGGVRDLWTGDGFRLRVSEKDWARGSEIVERIDRAIDTSAIACQEHSPGAFEDPEDAEQPD